MIEFESVGKTFRKGAAVVVDLSLRVPSDKVTVIVGPSGSGKTTTLRMVNRLLEPTSGRITWDGAPLRSKRKTALRRQMGYVNQSGGLFPHRTVIDNIGTVPGLLGWSGTTTQKRSTELLDAVGLDRRLAHRYPSQLSGGQQQRVAVARALAADPPVLLMDEPFSAVDPVVRGELHGFFLDLQRELSKTVILVTEDIDEAITLGDQVAILRVGGHLAQVGTPQQLLEEPADAFVGGFIGRDRGYRSLSLLAAGSLVLDRVKVVRDLEAASGKEPTLVLDGAARPVGWADPGHPGQVFAVGSTYDPESDNLQVALDSALTSPFGLAVAVEKSTGRYAGVVAAQTILSQVRDARASLVGSISLSDAEAGREVMGPAAVADPPASEAEADVDAGGVDAEDVEAGGVEAGGVEAGGVEAGGVDAEDEDGEAGGDPVTSGLTDEDTVVVRPLAVDPTAADESFDDGSSYQSDTLVEPAPESEQQFLRAPESDQRVEPGPFEPDPLDPRQFDPDQFDPGPFEPQQPSEAELEGAPRADTEAAPTPGGAHVWIDPDDTVVRR